MCHLGQVKLDSQGCCEICGKTQSESIINTTTIETDSEIAGILTQKIMEAILAQSQIIKELENIANLMNKTIQTKFGAKNIYETDMTIDQNKQKLIDTDNSASNDLEYLYKIVLEENLSQPLYKKKPFTLSLKIVDNNGKKQSLEHAVRFKIILCTGENPHKMLTHNASGDRVMLGTLEEEGISSIFFRKVIINDVSSRTESGTFSLIIMPIDAEYIKPLEISNLQVKAKKPSSDRAKKRRNVGGNEPTPEIE
ncbi:hypothetical protein SteCoe_25216 [Stentor coeruleus]|uniref:Uncharacterized protein n=1 Tax=Stentor coeruleus TaxID=5963 RepID=A0A1R2BG66_9CILI|nr:hypothetical protein SteCoe_25216 [Stentor coeruleus]